MKRAPYPTFTPDPKAPTYWRSLDELEKRPEIQAVIECEFPEGASQPPAELLSEPPLGSAADASRRKFLGVMSASLALAGLAGCRRPVEKILPYSKAPEDVIPGKALHFATTMPLLGTAFGLVVESHDGRPTKIDGNPKHPESANGSSLAWAQAAILDLYDPDRSNAPREGGVVKTRADADKALGALGDKLRRSQGKGFAILTEAHRSPTLMGALDRLKQAMPQAKVYRYEAFSRESSHEGTRLLFGTRMEAVHTTSQAKVLVALDSDFLVGEGSPLKNAAGWAEGRRPEAPLGSKVDVRKPEDAVRLYAAESTFTPTGALADHRLRLPSRDVAKVACALLVELRKNGVQIADDLGGAASAQAQGLSDKAQKWVTAAAKDLAKRKGAGLVVAGERQPAAIHAVAAAINLALDNAGEGKPVRYVPAFANAPEGASSLAELQKDVASKQVDTLLVLGGNPVFDAPADLQFGALVKGLAASIHVSSHVNETSAASTWHIPRAHFLEAWGDAVAEDGTLSLQQPLIHPMYDGVSDLEVVSLLLGSNESGYETLRKAWIGTRVGTEKDWRAVLHEGVSPQPAASAVSAGAPRMSDAAAALKALTLGSGREITFGIDPHALDGRYANCGWTQELPDSMHKLVWGNVAVVSPTTAKALGVADGDMLTITVGGGTAKVPALVGPGQADDSISLTLGQGRTEVGRVGKGVGFATNALRTSAGMGFASAEVQKAGDKTKLSRTQEHFLTENRPHVREATLKRYAEKNDFVKEGELPHPALLSLWYPPAPGNHAWGMTIDLSSCTGCSACVVACQAENNIPVVGAEQVQLSREMHWLRIDRYFTGNNPDEPTSISQPLTCQHCENAPCEQVCPVGATVHSPDGTNDMAYNRCIGTKYCANNCPYKVRRFNYFHYTKEVPESQKMAFNPNVTVRIRGIMEKCTFCIQRIQEAKIDAKRHDKEKIDRDKVPKTACQQACPTQAITFGDLSDAESGVSKAAALPRAYKLLEELNVKPRASYLARITNPNPELDGV